MKVRRRAGAPKGNYDVVFSGLMRRDNKVGLKTTQSGKLRLMFRLKPIDKNKEFEIPYGFVWDRSEPSYSSALGCLGVSASKLARIEDEQGIEAALLYFEDAAKKKSLTCSVNVKVDNDWGSFLKPAGKNEYVVRVLRVSTRHSETKIPVWVSVPESSGVSRRGGKYKKKAWKKIGWSLVVTSGERTGALMLLNSAYPFVKDEHDNWEFDAESDPRSEVTYNLLVLHDIPVDRINPDADFDDPENGMPELEKRILKKAVDFKIITNEQGWIDAIDKLSVPAVSSTEDEDEEEYASTRIADLFNAIDKAVRKEDGESAWKRAGVLSKAGKAWAKETLLPYLERKDIPADFHKMTDKQVGKIISAIQAA